MIDILSIRIYGDFTLADLIVLVAVVVASLLIARTLQVHLRRTFKDRVSPDVLNIVEKLTYYAVILIGVVSVLPLVGINLTGLLVAGGVVGVIIGFASQSVTANLVSGLFLLVERPIKVGDQITVEDVSGFVEDIRILSTIVRTYEGAYVRMPNDKVFTSHITNLVANVVRRFEYRIGVNYSDADRAVQIIRTLLYAHAFVLVHPAPEVFVDELGEDRIHILVRVWSPSSVWYDAKVDLLERIKSELERGGIRLPFPRRVTYLVEKRGEGEEEKYP